MHTPPFNNLAFFARMNFKKLTSFCALLILLFVQMALAQHNASHIDHANSFELATSHGDEHDHQDKSEKHQCPECILTKSLLTAYYNSPAPFTFSLKAESFISIDKTSVFSKSYFNPNTPRAPPSILI